jgi:putative alpha-1,2-mannosidase
LLTLLKPNVQRDIVRSLLNMYDQGGDLPKWPIANGYGSAMIGQHANIVIADAFFKGVKDFNITKAYEGMRKGSTQPQRHAGRGGLVEYNTLGYIPTEVAERGTSMTVEYAYDDWAISNFARVLGLKEDEELFKKKSLFYKVNLVELTIRTILILNSNISVQDRERENLIVQS